MALEAGVLNVQSSSDNLWAISSYGRRQEDEGKSRAERKGNQILSCYQKTTAETTNTLH